MVDPFSTWRDISASVGHLGRNLHDDVVAVQEMLNEVPAAEGGPYVKLAVDGRCGPKTIEAIRKFQLKHFGWSGADGLVERVKQTHKKLNEYYKPSLTSTSFLIKRSIVDRIGAEWEWEATQSEAEWYYRIEDYASTRAALYWFSRMPGAIPRKPRPDIFRGRPTQFNIKAPGGMRVTDLACPAIYTTREKGWLVSSHLIMSFTAGAVSLPMESLKRDTARRPTAADRGYIPTHVPPRFWRGEYRREGVLQFITEL